MGWLSTCWSIRLIKEVQATDVASTAALVAATSGEYQLRHVRRVTFNGSARTQMNDRQNQRIEVSSLKSIFDVKK